MRIFAGAHFSSCHGVLVTGPRLSPAIDDDRLRHDSLPHAAVVKLNGQSVGGNHRPFMPVFGPDVAWIIDPCSRRLPHLIHQIEVPAVLRDESRSGVWRHASLDALILAGKIEELRRGIGRDCRGSQSTLGDYSKLHRSAPFSMNHSLASRPSISFDRNQFRADALRPVGRVIRATL